MTNKEIMKSELLDIIFEHRNKIYGAYVLRKEYNQRLGTALGIAVSIVLLFILLSALKKNNGNAGSGVNAKEGVVVSVVEFPEKLPPEPIQQIKPPEPVAHTDYQNIIIVDDEEAQDLPNIETLENSIISNTNIAGLPSDDIHRPINENGNSGDANVVKPAVTEPEIKLPSYPPSFPGGESAWLGFLRKFLQAPEDLEPGERKEVIVRFWIDEQGAISKFEIIQSGGNSFDKEVLRVMKKMPKWEPAMQNGRRVAVAFTQPVTFIGVEE